MVLSFLSFQPLSPSGSVYISPSRCITSAALCRNRLNTRARAEHADSAFGLGVLPLWPGFLLLINVEFAFAKHDTALNIYHVVHGATSVNRHGLGSALCEASQRGVTLRKNTQNADIRGPSGCLSAEVIPQGV